MQQQTLTRGGYLGGLHGGQNQNWNHNPWDLVWRA